MSNFIKKHICLYLICKRNINKRGKQKKNDKCLHGDLKFQEHFTGEYDIIKLQFK